MELSYDGFSFTLNQAYVKPALFISVSGSHAYGWSSATSDLDVRLAWFPDIKQALSIFYRGHPSEQRYSTDDKKIVDFTSYPIQNFLGLLEKGNGNCLENLFQHKLVEKKQLVRNLQKLMLKNLHVGFLKHYLGYSQSLLKDLSIESRLQAYGEQKLLLQAYRVLMSGIILSADGKIVSNLVDQNEIMTPVRCKEILSDYLNGKGSTAETLKGAYVEIDSLQKLLQSEIDTHILPTSDHLGLKVQLDNWLRDYYI